MSAVGCVLLRVKPELIAIPVLTSIEPSPDRPGCTRIKIRRDYTVVQVCTYLTKNQYHYQPVLASKCILAVARIQAACISGSHSDPSMHSHSPDPQRVAPASSSSTQSRAW